MCSGVLKEVKSSHINWILNFFFIFCLSLSFLMQASTVSQGGWGYWGSWGKSILSTATATVATVGECRGPVQTGWWYFQLATWLIKLDIVQSLCLFSPSRPGAHSGHREGRDNSGDPQSHRTISTCRARAERAEWVCVLNNIRYHLTSPWCTDFVLEYVCLCLSFSGWT